MINLPQPVSISPRVFVADGFVSDPEVAKVLARYDASGVPNAAVHWDTGLAGRSAELPVADDPLLGVLARRIEDVLGFGCELPDPTFRYRRYAPGDYHPAHVDCYEIEGLHLVATAILYLTDARDGGETVFPEFAAPVVIAARRGRLALWFNYTPDGRPDPCSRHRSERLQAGEKATLAYFVYAPLSCSARAPRVAARRRPELVCA